MGVGLGDGVQWTGGGPAGEEELRVISVRRGENKESVVLCVGGGLVGVDVQGELLMMATFFRQGDKSVWQPEI